jgi:hypothetical protein
MAKRTNSAAVWTPAFRIAAPRWLSTVLMLIPSARAICLLELPSAISWATSSSRSVKHSSRLRGRSLTAASSSSSETNEEK